MKNIVDLNALMASGKVAGGKKVKAHGLMANEEWVRLIDNAAKGDLEAATDLAEAYFKGSFGEKNLAKARKWCAYAAKKGHERAASLLEEIRE